MSLSFFGGKFSMNETTNSVSSNDGIATTSYVDGRITSLVNAAPTVLDTLKELADAIGSDPNFSGTITTLVNTKADKDSPTFTGTVKIPVSSANAGVVHNSALGVLSTSLIVNADVASNAEIADTKLAMISTAGKVSNSATSATSSNTNSAIVTRDGAGAFAAGAITMTGATVSGLSNAGVVHNAVGGLLSTSLIVNADITDATIASGKLQSSIALTGVPTAPTASSGTISTQLATTAFVQTAVSTAVSSLVASAPDALDTLNELALALGSDANFSATIATSIGQKASLSGATFTGAVNGITKGMVGLGDVNNTSDAAKPISTLQQTALDLKAPLLNPALTGVPTAPTASNSSNDTTIATTAFVKTSISSISTTVTAANSATDSANSAATSANAAALSATGAAASATGAASSATTAATSANTAAASATAAAGSATTAATSATNAATSANSAASSANSAASSIGAFTSAANSATISANSAASSANSAAGLANTATSSAISATTAAISAAEAANAAASVTNSAIATAQSTANTALLAANAAQESADSTSTSVATFVQRKLSEIKILNTDSTIFGGEKPGKAVAGRSVGWQFDNKTTASDKINWYYYIKDVYKNTIRVNQINGIGAYCVIEQGVDSVQIPFFIIYTSTSAFFYSYESQPADRNKTLLLFTGTDDVTVHPEIPAGQRKQLLRNSPYERGTLNTTEVIQAISIHTSSTGDAGKFDFICNELGFYSVDYSQVNLCVTNVSPISDAVLTGIPTAMTAAVGTNTTQLATTAFVKNAVSIQILSSAPTSTYAGMLYYDTSIPRLRLRNAANNDWIAI